MKFEPCKIIFNRTAEADEFFEKSQATVSSRYDLDRTIEFDSDADRDAAYNELCRLRSTGYLSF